MMYNAHLLAMVELFPRKYTPPAEATQAITLVQADKLKYWQRDILTKVDTLLKRGFQESELSELDGIIVLGASMHYKRGGWKFSNFVETDPNPLVGGHFRITAAKYLFTHGFRGDFLVTGGLQRNDPSGREASKAETLATAIRKKVPKASIIPIGTKENGHTQGNVMDFVRHLQEGDTTLEGNRYGILTSGWHMPRALTFFLNEEFFESHGIEFTAIVADDIARRDTIFHRQKVKRLVTHPRMDDRIQTEAQGIVDLFSGIYQPVPK